VLSIKIFRFEPIGRYNGRTDFHDPYFKPVRGDIKSFQFLLKIRYGFQCLRKVYPWRYLGSGRIPCHFTGFGNPEQTIGNFLTNARSINAALADSFESVATVFPVYHSDNPRLLQAIPHRKQCRCPVSADLHFSSVFSWHIYLPFATSILPDRRSVSSGGCGSTKPQ